MDLKEAIREIWDFPKEGICFKDITTLLKDGPAFRQAVAAMTGHFQHKTVDLVVAPEARGFMLGAPVALALQAGFVPVRKPGKLPAPALHYVYELEYGTDALEMHKDAIAPGQRVLVVDDLLATGGTSAAIVKMIEALGGEVVGLSFLIELSALPGREVLAPYAVEAVLQY